MGQYPGLRLLIEDAHARRLHPRKFASELYRHYKPLGIWTDWDCVARTSLGELRNRAGLQIELDRHPPDDTTRYFRPTAANPCSGCLALSHHPDGTFRLYSFQEILDGDAMGSNRGPWQGWHIRSGVCHPNCLCNSLMRFSPVVAEIVWAKDYPKWAAMYAARRINEKIARFRAKAAARAAR